MKRKEFQRVALLCLLVMAISSAAIAEGPIQKKLRGSIDASGPWNVRGQWSLTLREDSSKADFSADLNMQRSDFWLLQNGKPDNPTGLGFHTHHVALLDADVKSTANGIEVSGIATITANGSPAPVSPSPVTIDITEGSLMEYSNISVTFASPGSNHFGTDPLTGVVRNAKRHEDQDK